MSTGEESKTHEVDAMTAIKAVGDMLMAVIQKNKLLEAENKRLRKLLTLFLEASAACDTSICGLALDRIFLEVLYEQ